MTNKKDSKKLAEGLENETTSVETTNVDFANREYLEKNAPVFNPDFVSKKYDEEREPKVQNGLETIAELMPNQINPLLILLGKWWEVKPARAEIKKMIDAEAEELNIPADIYLQEKLRENVDKLSQIQNAIDRLRYSITYFKPRTSKSQFKQLAIEGVLYNVNLHRVEELKKEFPNDKEKIKNIIIKESSKVEILEL